MDITLYSGFYKKHNSTKLPPLNPGLSAVTYSCYLLDATSITNPVVTIERDAIERPYVYKFNYAYIPDFERYYFIDDITTSNNLWVFSMSVDVLASYKSAINGSSQYVVRSSSASDENITDKLYITKPMSLSTRNAVSEYSTGYVVRQINMHAEEPSTGQVFYFNYENRLPENGVCFGIIGSNGVGANYYICTEDAFINFVTQVFAFVPSDMGSLSSGLSKTLLDLEQYIVSVVRLPVMPHSSNLGGRLTSVKLGGHDIPCDCYSIVPGYHYEEYSLVNELTLPQHPNISTHAYYGMPPFTKYTLDFLPLGSIPLDSAKIYGYDKIQIKWRIDFVSGLAWFQVGYEPYYNRFITLFTDVAQVGIPIPLSQLKVDSKTGIGLAVANFASDVFKNIANSSPVINSADTNKTINRTTTGGVRVWRAEERKSVPGTTAIDNAIGNFFSPNTNILDEIIDYAGELFGDIVTKGSTGSYLNIVGGRPTVRAFFLDQAENDNARFGSPLYQVKQLSTLTGFCLCKNATLDIVSSNLASALPVEVRGIINLLNTGIYLE